MSRQPLLSAVAADLIDLKVKPTDSFATLQRQFYRIMRRHGVKQGTKTATGGILCNNPDWQGAQDIFLARVASTYEWEMTCAKTPKDLRC